MREWLEARGGRPLALDVVSAGPHSRRTWRLYQLAFGEAASIGIRAVKPSDYDPAIWWRSSEGAKDVVAEALAYAWTTC